MDSRNKVTDQELLNVLSEIMEGRIIQSAIGDDFYKNTMGLFISSHGYNDISTAWKFTNRTKSIKLTEYIHQNDLEKEFNHFRQLELLSSEEKFLRGIKHYGDKPGLDEYINILKTQKIPNVYIDMSAEQPDIRWSSPTWIPSSRLEIPSLQIMIGLYYRELFYRMTSEQRLQTLRTAMDKLYDDIELLKVNPTTKITIFSNRRVLLPWLHLICKVLLSEVPNQILGISNVQVAMENGITPSGTIAHEMHMVMAALAYDGTEKSIKNSQIKLVTDWVDYYGTEMSVLLTDTFTTAKSIEWYPKELVARYKAGRIDSKNPRLGIPEIHQWFKDCGCDPFKKAAIPSDGLSISEAVEFERIFGQSSGLIIGAPGTLVGDLGLPKISIVSKVDMADGKSCVKISDNLDKKMGADADEYAEVLDIHETYHKTPLV